MRPRPIRRSATLSYALAFVVLLFGWALTALVAWRLFHTTRMLDAARFQRLVHQSTETLRDRLEKYHLALTGLAEFVAGRSATSTAEWRFRLQLLWPEQNYPGLLEIGFAELSTTESNPISQSSQAGHRDPDFPEANAQSFLLRHGWVRPPSTMDGLDPRFLEATPAAEVAHQALREGRMEICYNRELSSEIGGNPARGLTFFVPVYYPPDSAPAAHATETLAGERRRVAQGPARGVVFGSIEPNLLLAHLFGAAPRELDFDLFSSESPELQTWLNPRGPEPAALRKDSRAHLETYVTLPVGEEQWTAHFFSTPLFVKESTRERPWLALGVGITLSCMVAAMLLQQIRARLRQEAVASELRSACVDLQRAQNERGRIGRDLHDGAIQSLYGLQLSLGHYERLLERDPVAARGLLGRCRTAVDALIADLRAFIVQQSSAGEEAEVSSNPAATLEQLVRRFQSASATPIEVLIPDAAALQLSRAEQVHLRQIAQEALSNSLRHARAHHIQVELSHQNGHLRLRIADDGQGFDVARAHAAGQGLANMQARALQLGGALRVDTRPGRGTEVLLELPIHSPASDFHD